MAKYENLSDTIGKMKRAAIDCWMADQSFYPNWGNDKIYAKWGWMLNFYNRPDENGNGGGDGNGVKDSCAAQFDEIRAAIDATVSPWLGLPDGSNCTTPRGMANSAAAQLGTSGVGASVQNSGGIDTSNNTVHEVVINRLEGQFRAPFLDKYYTQLSKVVHGLGDACAILEINYAAELSMWPAARTDVATICDNAREAWKQKADKAALANGTMVLTVVAAVAGAVSSIVTAGAGTVAAVAALGGVAALANSAVQGISAQAVISGDTYEQILGKLQESLGNLNDALRKQEQALGTMLSSAETTMRASLADYDLDAFALGSYPASDGSMRMDRSDTSMVSTNMTRIHTALGQASSALGSAPGGNPTPRNAVIGAGAGGTHYAATGLYALVARCLTITAAEYERGQKLFQATADDFFGADADAAHTVAALLADEALHADLGV